VNFFLDDNADTAPSQGLYVVEMGSNDVRDALVAYLEAMMQNPPQNPFHAAGAVLQTALNAIMANIQTLHDKGAEDFLILNVPPIGYTPALSALDEALAAQYPYVAPGDIIGLRVGKDIKGLLVHVQFRKVYAGVRRL